MARIEELLSVRGSNWAELARQVGKTANSGSQWSSRRALPRQQTLQRIAAVLGVPISFLIAGTGPPHLTRARSDVEQQIVELMHSMSSTELAALLAAARGLAGSLPDA